MNFHILTPELQDYILVILFTWCLASSNLASHVYSRYFFNRAINPLIVQCAVKAMICLSALMLLSIHDLFVAAIWRQLIGIFLGIFAAWFVTRIELMINRFVQRRKNKNRSIPARQRNDYYLHTGPSKAVLSLASGYRFFGKANLKNLHAHYAAHETRQVNFSLVTVLLIAVFEEIIFRGCLVQCCYLLPVSMTKIALMITVIIFGISHASFGLWQVAAKTVLGACCMVAVLICHTILPALIIHGYLNWTAFRCQCR